MRATAIMLTAVVSIGAVVLSSDLNNSAFAATITPTVKLDGKAVTFPDVLPYVNEDNRTLVPIRFVSEALGCKVIWEGTNELVTIIKGDTRILFRIGENTSIVNNSKVDTKKEFDTKAVLKSDRTMVPLRFISETLGVGVSWDEANNIVILRSDGTVETVVTPTPTPISIITTPKNTPIIIDHSNDPKPATPTPVQTPIPTPKKTVGYVETFDLSEGFEPPQGFIQPKLRIAHDDGQAGWFNISIQNMYDYKDAGNYAYKIECTNIDLCNTYIDTNGIQRRRDDWNYTTEALKSKYVRNILGIFSANSYGYSVSWHTDAYTIKLKPNDVLDMKFTIRSDYYEQVYTKSVTVREKTIIR